MKMKFLSCILLAICFLFGACSFDTLAGGNNANDDGDTSGTEQPSDPTTDPTAPDDPSEPSDPSDPNEGDDPIVSVGEATRYTMPQYKITKTIVDFQYGLASPYDKYTNTVAQGWTGFLSRSFSDVAPTYSYTPNASSDQIKYQALGDWDTVDSADSCNCYVIYPSSSVTNGSVSSTFLTYIPPLQAAGTAMSSGAYPAEYTNYTDLSAYDNLSFLLSVENGVEEDVSFHIQIKNANGTEYTLYDYTGEHNRILINADLTQIPKDERDQIEYIKIVHRVIDMSPDAQPITVRWFKIEAGTNDSIETKSQTINGMACESEYMSDMLYTMCGAYSASGFYDTEDKKYKLWYGASVPEEQSTDNIYYIEADSVEGQWSKPVRIMTDDGSRTGMNLVDSTGKLRGASDPVGYGGDPSVIKVNGVYYMYFSGIEWGLDDGTYTHWNKIYLATSQDGKHWTSQGAVVDTATGGSLGYGSGSPSAVYYNGVFYLYYYSQSYDVNYPNEAGGLVLKTATDGIHFGEAISINRKMSTLDVKYIPSLFKWVGTYYTEEGQFGDCKAGVRVAFSEDGIEWDFDYSDESLIAQNSSAYINHNPGIIGTEYGYAGETMYVTYGSNDLPLTVDGYWFSSAQYDARQIEFSKLQVR